MASSQPRPDYLSAIAELFTNRRLFIERLIKVENKDRKIVPFRFSNIQNLYWENQSRRDIVVKPSQVGFSTLLIADALVDVITTPGTTAVIVAYEEFITQRLLNKAQAFYDLLPKDMKPEMGHSSSHEKSFPDINSTLYIGTARAFTFGRGDTIHKLLCDEYAFWPDPERIMVPALQRVPANGTVRVFSTPNGEGNPYHKLYKQAKEGELLGDSIFKAHFFPWYLHEEYFYREDDPRALPRDKTEVLANLDGEELQLLERGLTQDQIRWRRAKIKELEQMTGDPTRALAMFKQEFPEDDESCFLVAGDSFYPAEQINSIRAGCTNPIAKLRLEYTLDELDTKIQEVYADIWEMPQEGLKYTIVVDPGQGINTMTGITVWRFFRDENGLDHGKHCATIHGLIKPEHAAPISTKLGTLYNRAFLVSEATGHGLAVTTNSFVRKYGNVYLRKNIRSNKVVMEIGWWTDRSSKPYMCTELRRLLPRMEIRDARIVSEFRNIRDEAGQIISVGLDDLHDTAAMAVATRESQAIERGVVGTAGWGPDWGRTKSSHGGIELTGLI